MAKGGEVPRFHFLRRGILFAVLMTAGFPAVFPLTVTVTGGYGFVIDQADLTGGAGSDLEPTYESLDNSILIDIGDTTGSTDAWQIQVHKENATWHASLSLSILRTGSGTGTVTGGNSIPVELTGTDQVFFEGEGDNTGIPVKIILDGVSILIPADTYTTTIYVTVVDLP